MIRIRISQNQKDRLEDMICSDAKKAGTGLYKVLEKPDVKNLLKTKPPYRKLYEELYDTQSGEPSQEKVEELLTADKNKLKDYINRFGSFGMKDSKGKDLAAELLEKVFRYDTFSQRAVAVDILTEMGVSVCPYCNRQYTFTSRNGKVRAQLDHYYPKTLYPYLALSLYNMVPSCGICNQAKSSLNTLKTPIMYPYEEDFEDEARFEIAANSTGDYARILHDGAGTFTVKLNTEKAKNADSINTQMKKLHLDELYNMHTDYIRDIIKRKTVYTPERIDELCETFPRLFRSREEVKRTLCMADTARENWGKRPLSKLTYDIENQIEKGKIGIES